MGLDSAGDQIFPVRQRIAVFLQARQAAAPAKLPERIDDRVKLVGAKAAAALNLRRRQTQARLGGEQFKDSFPGPALGGN
jgi:hypothetical protein